MSNANTIKRQVGGGAVQTIGAVGTLAPIVNPGFDIAGVFQFNGLYGPIGFDEEAVSLLPQIVLGGYVPLSIGTQTSYSTVLGGPNYVPDLIGGTGAIKGTGQILHIAATGSFSGMTANSTKIALALYEAPAAILPFPLGEPSAIVADFSNLVASSSAIQVPSSEGIFTFDVYLQLDNQGNLSGWYEGFVSGTVIAQTAIESVTGLQGEADLNFLFAATLSVSAPSTAVITLDEFRIDLEAPGASTTALQSEVGTFASITNPVINTPTAFSFSVPPLFDGASATNMGGVIPLSAGVTGLYAGTGAVLAVGAAGTLIGGITGTTTLKLDLYEVPAAVVAAGLSTTVFNGWNKIGSSGTVTLPFQPAALSFQFDAQLQLDAEGDLEGTYLVSIADGTVVPTTAIDAISGLVGEADLNFVLVATIGGGAYPGISLVLNAFTLGAV